jgi:hypothetical protein
VSENGCFQARIGKDKSQKVLTVYRGAKSEGKTASRPRIAPLPGWRTAARPNLSSLEILSGGAEPNAGCGVKGYVVPRARSGLWDSGGDVEWDNIAVIEFMTLVRESLATAPC